MDKEVEVEDTWLSEGWDHCYCPRCGGQAVVDFTNDSGVCCRNGCY